MQTIGHIPGSLANSKGEFSEGNPDTGEMATLTKAAFFNTVQRELQSLLTQHGVALQPEKSNQVSRLLNDTLQPFYNPHGFSTTPVNALTVLPEVLTPDHTVNITNHQDGSVSIDPDQLFIYAGLYQINTSSYAEQARRFVLAPDTIYHLRWQPDRGFVLMDCMDNHYNRLGVAESDPSFDTTPHDMLIATLTTQGRHDVTIIPLRNHPGLRLYWMIHHQMACLQDVKLWELDQLIPVATHTLNWAKTPGISWQGVVNMDLGQHYRANRSQGGNDNSFGVIATRYNAILYNSYTAGKPDQTDWYYTFRV